MISDYIYHWWNGDAAKYYTFLFLEVPQANKLFKLGLYLAGLAALFDLVKVKDFICTTRKAFFAVSFTYRFSRLLLDSYSIMVRSLFIPLYYITIKLEGSTPKPFQTLFGEVVAYHLERSLDQATLSTSQKWINRFLLWMEGRPPSEAQVKATAYLLFVILAALEILTS